MRGLIEFQLFKPGADKNSRHVYVENIVIGNIILQFANSNLFLIKILF